MNRNDFSIKADGNGYDIYYLGNRICGKRHISLGDTSSLIDNANRVISEIMNGRHIINLNVKEKK